MSPQWLPQNIQKRLLLYVLQQVSLFSGIDMPNLKEVSLNNIVLNNVSLDPEKVGKVLGCSLRYGEVGHLEINPASNGVLIGSGGVNIDARDIELVLSPDIDMDQDISVSALFLLAQSTADFANTLMSDVLDGEVVDDSDAIAELDVSIENRLRSDSNSSVSSSNSATKKPSALSGVMAKAVEMALAKLRVKLVNLKIKTVSDLTDVVLEIDELNFSTQNGVRKILVSGVRFITLRPDVTPVNYEQDNEVEKPEKNDEKPEDEDYEVGDIDDSLLGSMVFTHEEASSIYMSAIDQSFDNGTDGPQLGENIDNKPKIPKPSPTTVMFINNIQIEFEGLSPIFNLTTRVDSVKASLTPLFSTIVSILTGITMSVKLKEYQKRKRNYSKLSGEYGASRFPQYSNDDEIYDDDENGHENGEEALLFNKIHINSVELSTTSALLHSGEFATPNTVNIIIQNFNVKQKSENYTFGGIETLKLMKGEQEIFSFKNNPNSEMSQDELESSVISTGQLYSSPVQPKPRRADIRFEIITNEGQNKEVVVLLSKQMTFRLDAPVSAIIFDMLESALDVFTSISSLASALELLHSMNRPKFVIENKVNPEPTTQVIFQTSDIFVELLMSVNSNIRASISPIHFNLLQNKCSIAQVLFTRKSFGQESKIGSISDIRLNIKNEEFVTFVNRYQSSNGSNVLPRDVKMIASTSIKIGIVDFEVCLVELKQLINEFSDYFEISSVLRMKGSMYKQKLSSVQDPLVQSLHLAKQRKTVRLGISNTHNLAYNGPKMNIVSFMLRIANISLKVNNINPDFGSLVIVTNDVLFYQLKDDIQGSIPSVDAYRYYNGEIVEYLLHPYKKKENFSFPLVLIHFKNNEKAKSIDVTIRNMLVEYHTYWLELLGKNKLESDGLQHPNKNQTNSNHNAKNQNGMQSSNFDIRFTLYDCVCALNPLRLKCKSYAVVGKGTSDIIFANDQVSLKSSLRNISVLLIDDKNNEVDGDEVNMNNHKTSGQAYATPLTHYLSHGYTNIVNINVTHIGITFNTNIEQSVQRNKLLGVTDSLALVDFKINSDEHILEVCADSAHTLLQMINDLKLPLNYTDADRARVTLDNDLNLLDDMNKSQFVSLSLSKFGTGRSLDSKDECALGGTFFDVQHPSKTIDIDKHSDDSELGSTIRNVSTLTFDEDHFAGTNKVDDTQKVIPLKMNLNLCKVKVYLYDGYDWKTTRKAIKGAAKRVETKLKKRKEEIINDEEHPDENIEENVFNSIYLTMPSDHRVEDFTRCINEKVQNNKPLDGISKRLESSPEFGKNYKNLKLRRSSYHKILFDLRSIEVDVSIFSSRDPRYELTDDTLEIELLNSVEVRLDTICIYDNLPSSTWNKFLSYMNILGEREIGTSMLKLSITNVRPDPSIVSSEARVELSVLPLRLHIDQDTLEFLTRFFDFKDERFYLPPDEDIYFQRFKTGPIRLKIDYKPKTIDYIGLRSGNTGELINFFILDGSEMTLQLINTHGILGMNRLGRRLGSIWGPQIQHTQLGGLLAGVSPVKSIVNIGGGVKDLIVIPMQEYKKDGRILRSLKKGTASFAKTTGYELFNLGAKLASGAQVWLEQGEEYLGGEGQAIRQPHKLDRKKSKQKSEDDLDFLEFYDNEKIKSKSKKDLLASSQMLNRTIKLGKDQFGGGKQYSYIGIDDEIYDEEIAEEDERTFLGVSMLMLDSVSKPKQIKGKFDEVDDNDKEDEDEDDTDRLEQEKLISLYSNQPATIEDGIKSAYKSMGKNLLSTKKVILRLKDDVNDAESFQEALITVLKSSPIVLIRPLIGTTEAISKTFMGIGNEIDPQKMIESKDKYQYDES